MQVEHLTAYGIPEIVVDNWRTKLGPELLPIQKRAVVDYQILAGQSLLIAAPTSSGKTFCGELAAVAAVFKSKKALFVVPLKSIAEERYADFVSRYGNLGIKTVISTGDRSEFDRDIEKGDFYLGILIYEKFNQLLVKNIDLLSSVDLILIDEIQMIGETERGPCLELALLKVLHSGYRPQLLALSAVLKNAQQLADWLGCQLVEDSFRPVELRQGILKDGVFHYRTFNERREGKEPLSEVSSDETEELLLNNIEHLVDQGEQVLVFLKTRRACEQLAVALAERNFWSPAEESRETLKAEVGSTLGKRLLETLQSGVAFHHADLSYRQRRILEEGFRWGEIKVMVSTTTLAMGVNLPAQSVFIDCYKYQLGKHSGKAMVVPLSWSEYEAMSGRAGRYGAEKTHPLVPSQEGNGKPCLASLRAKRSNLPTLTGSDLGIASSRKALLATTCSTVSQEGKEKIDTQCANEFAPAKNLASPRLSERDASIPTRPNGDGDIPVGESGSRQSDENCSARSATSGAGNSENSPLAKGDQGGCRASHQSDKYNPLTPFAKGECRSDESTAFGRSILIAGSRAEAETMWQTYIKGTPERLVSRLNGRSVYDIILDLIASGVARQVAEVYPLLQKSYYVCGGGVFNEGVVGEVLRRLEQLKLVFISTGPEGGKSDDAQQVMEFLQNPPAKAGGAPVPTPSQGRPTKTHPLIPSREGNEKEPPPQGVGYREFSQEGNGTEYSPQGVGYRAPGGGLVYSNSVNPPQAVGHPRDRREFEDSPLAKGDQGGCRIPSCNGDHNPLTPFTKGECTSTVVASPIGKLVSLRGIGVASAMMIVSFCRRYRLTDRLSWLCFVLSLPDANLASLYIDREEEARGCYRRLLIDYVASAKAVATDLHKMSAEDYVLSTEQSVRLKGAFLLLDWITELPTAEVELRYRINVGSILQIAETAAWLLNSAGEIAMLLNRPAELASDLKEFAEAVACGFDLPGSILHDLGLSAEQRDLVWGLFNAGVTGSAQFTAENRGKIASVVGEALADQLIEKFRTINENHNQSPAEVGSMSQLKLRGQMRGDRVYFSFGDREIDITPKSFNYLFKLSVARFLNRDGWLNKEEMEPGFNQAKNIYRVKQELKRFATGLEDRIENNKSGFYRINLTPQQIRIDYDSMKSFSDMELAELTKRLEQRAVC